MAFEPVTAALSLGKSLIERLVPDKAAAQQAEQELEKLAQSGELQLLLGQQQINLVEASHKSVFVAGWRPFIGWICGVGLGYNFVLYPILDIWVEMPPIDSAPLMALITSMLGLAGYRTLEKKEGVAST